MFYVNENGGKYTVASEKWARLYEMGGLSVKDPVAAFHTAREAHAFVKARERGEPFVKSKTMQRLVIQTDKAPAVEGGQAPIFSAPKNASKAEIRQSQMQDYKPRDLKGGPVIEVYYGAAGDGKGVPPYKPVYPTKDAAMKAALQELCDYYKFHASFREGVVDVTTVAGEWYFRYNDRPIQLFHKNPEQRFYGSGKKKTGDYHNQMMRFYSPADVIHYIYLHERKRIFDLGEGIEEQQ